MKQLKKFKKVATLALAIAAGFGVTGTANAALSGLTAQSTLIVDTFRILTSLAGAGTAATLTVTDLPGVIGPTDLTTTSTKLTDTAKTSVTLSGFATPAQPATTVNGLGGIDIAPVCIGVPCTILNNDFSPHPPFPSAGTQYARADSYLVGTPVAVPQVFAPAGAFAATTAEVQLTSSATGNALANLSLVSSFIVSAAVDTTVFLDFFATVFSFAAISSDAQGLAADTAFNLSFSAKQIGPTGALLSINAANGGGFFNPFAAVQTTDSISGAGQSYDDSIARTEYTSAGFVLKAGKSYNFTIDHSTNADGTLLIPEPGSLALTGIALVGLFGARRKMKRA